MRFESISDGALARYERYFFEDICNITVGERDSFSTPLPQIEGLSFACVQDTVERLTEEGGSGRLSRFQWRNFIFAPVDRNVSLKDAYEDIFDELRQKVPSLFIRSYVYLVFLRVYGSSSLFSDGVLGGDSHELTKKDYRIYQWNTNYDIVRVSPSDLAEIGRPRQMVSHADDDSSVPVGSSVDRVFIVSDPNAELQRIQDANSDVIDAVKAFTGNLGLVKQTEEMLQNVKRSLAQPHSHVLLEGPARSGKTIIAMSLLASEPDAKMLLMNWYFYDALKDAFRIWGKQDEGEIAKLFTTPPELKREIVRDENDVRLLELVDEFPQIMPALIGMWRTPPELSRLAKWVKDEDSNEWLVDGQGLSSGDVAYVRRRRGGKPMVQLVLIDEIVSGSRGRPLRRISIPLPYAERPYGVRLEDSLGEGRGKWGDILEHLETLAALVADSDAATVRAGIIKSIAEALNRNGQRFFHHDRNQQEGLWVDSRGGIERKLIPENGLLICDEAQRLGDYSGLDECAWACSRVGNTFLCGDDNQRLNRRGDRGLSPILDELSVARFHFSESVGIPAEIELLVHALLGEAEPPITAGPFSIKLIYKDDLALVKAFNDDPSSKKHYAMPMSTGFYSSDYVPCITRSSTPTEKCTEACEGEGVGGFCSHRYIRALSPVSDPPWMREARKDLSRSYKFFCAEAIMPNYALSAYELISREVEGLYLKIPWQIGLGVLRAPIDGEETPSWIKRHLYVLMTRATSRLVIDIENRELFESFRRICEAARIDWRL